jgi:hypothetical protein
MHLLPHVPSCQMGPRAAYGHNSMVYKGVAEMAFQMDGIVSGPYLRYLSLRPLSTRQSPIGASKNVSTFGMINRRRCTAIEKRLM